MCCDKWYNELLPPSQIGRSARINSWPADFFCCCLFINDITNLKLSDKSKLYLYADTAMFCKSKNEKELQILTQSQFDMICKRQKINRLILNVSKTKLVLFGRKSKIKHIKVDVYFENLHGRKSGGGGG